MGLKILHSADWHLDSPFAGFPEEEREFLKQQQRRIPDLVAELCRRENCDLMLLAGDILDGKPSRETLDNLKAALRHSRAPVLIAPGNHDFCAPDSPWLEEQWPENVYIFTGGMESVAIEALHCRVYGGGFQSMDCPPLLEGFHAEGEERYQLAVLHGDPTRKDSPYNPITASQARRSGLRYLALGHIHKAGAFRAGDVPCAWPGCPMGRGWDETGEKGVCIVTLGDDGACDIQAVALDTVRFHQMEVEVGADPLSALETALPAGGSDDFYRVALTGSAQVDCKKLSAQLSGFPHLELVDKLSPPMDLWAGAGEDTLEGRYFARLKQAMEENPDDADRIRLAAEISRKILDGRTVTL